MSLLDLITGTPNDYVGQNFPVDAPPAADGGDDPLSKLKALLQQAVASPQNTTPAPGQTPTDFSAAARQPDSVPLPMPRPASAPQAAPSIDDTVLNGLGGSPSPMNIAPPMADPNTQNAVTSFAPTDIQRAQQGLPPIPTTGLPGSTQNKGDNFGLLSMIAPNFTRDNANNIGKSLASLGGGLSTVTGNTAGGAFARGMGGSLKSGTSYDKDTSDRALKELKAMQEAQAAGDNAKYKAALTNYYNILAKAKTDAAAAGGAGTTTTRRQTQWDDPRFRFDRFRTAAAASDKAIDNEFVNDPRARRFASPDDRKALTAEIAQRKKDARSELQKRYEVGSDDGTPAQSKGKTSTGASASNPGEISFSGNGTQASPYQPASKADYDDIPSGAYYIHPTRGLVIKG